MVALYGILVLLYVGEHVVVVVLCFESCTAAVDFLRSDLLLWSSESRSTFFYIVQDLLHFLLGFEEGAWLSGFVRRLRFCRRVLFLFLELFVELGHNVPQLAL